MRQVLLSLMAILLATLASSQPTPIDTQSFSLVTDMDFLADPLAELYDVLALNLSSISEVVQQANRERQTLCNKDVYTPLTDRSGSEVSGFCWEDGDDTVDYWYPQGTTTTHDAYSSGEYENYQLVVNSWYHVPANEGPNAPDKGVRITVTNWDDVGPNNYRHILLVQPIPGGNYATVEVHAGGIMWYGNILHVVDTYAGIRFFDMDHIYEVNTDNTTLFGRQDDGKFYAYGYQYVLPQIGSANNTGLEFRYSFISLDRLSNPVSLIVGEYCPANTPNTTRVVRYPLNTTTHLLLEGANSTTYSSEAYSTGIYQMQGALARDGKFWFGSSNGGNGPEGHYGFLRVWERNTTIVRTYNWAYGSEDMSYWADPFGTDQIWTLTEYPGFRTVLSVPAEEWN